MRFPERCHRATALPVFQTPSMPPSVHARIMGRQLEHSYGQIQDIAVKAIEGPSTSLAGTQATGLSLPARMPGGLQNE